MKPAFRSEKTTRQPLALQPQLKPEECKEEEPLEGLRPLDLEDFHDDLMENLVSREQFIQHLIAELIHAIQLAEEITQDISAFKRAMNAKKAGQFLAKIKSKLDVALTTRESCWQTFHMCSGIIERLGLDPVLSALEKDASAGGDQDLPEEQLQSQFARSQAALNKASALVEQLELAINTRFGNLSSVPPDAAELNGAKIISQAAIEEADEVANDFAIENPVQDAPVQVDDIAKQRLKTSTALSNTGVLQSAPEIKPQANCFLEKNGLLEFTDVLIRKGAGFREGLVDTQSTPAGGTNISCRSQNSTYLGVKLEEGDVIRSHSLFRRNTSGAPIALGLLTQDHTGKVTDNSEGSLKKEELAKVALKQAQMLLSNYIPGSGDIIIRGSDPVMANKVYAALLLLKSGHEELDKINILSFVTGCDGPGRFMPNYFFIFMQLGRHIASAMYTESAAHLGMITTIRYNFFNAKMRLNQVNAQELQPEPDTFFEDDLINVEGLFRNGVGA